MVSKLILVPILFIGIFAALNICGLGNSVSEAGNYTLGAVKSGAEYWQDSNGHGVMYTNGTLMGEAGTFVAQNDTYGVWALNGTGYPIGWGCTLSTSSSLFGFEFGGILSNLGLMTILIGIVAFATAFGITAFGSGLKGVSIIMIVGIGTFSAIWTALSGAALSLITTLPLSSGWFLYFALSIAYVLGTITTFVSPSGGSE